MARVRPSTRQQNGQTVATAGRQKKEKNACEEVPSVLYDSARALRNVPVFLFQEGNDDSVSAIYHEIAKITQGATAFFDATAASRLADLLRAVAAFAAGGIRALATQRTEAATLLLTQMKR
jgi:hypothetical protein